MHLNIVSCCLYVVTKSALQTRVELASSQSELVYYPLYYLFIILGIFVWSQAVSLSASSPLVQKILGHNHTQLRVATAD
jgi:hypothetical protein